MLLKAWRGEERFWKIWWFFGVPLQAAWWTAYFYFWSGTLAPETLFLLTVWFWPVALYGLAIFAVLFLIWSVLAWRCASNVTNTLWANFARVLIGVTLGSFITECVLILTAPLN
jgi:hypothetical protein